MKRILTLAAACAVFTLPASLAAAPESDNPKEQTEAKKQGENAAKEDAKDDADGDRKICRRIKEVGTRFSQKVCMTKDEWRAQWSGAQDAVREERDR